MNRGKYVIPEVKGVVLDNCLQNKDIVVVCFGGLIEAFFSLSLLEIYNYHKPGRKMYWSGDKCFLPLIKMNGLTRGLFDEIDQSVVDRFPTPLFLDKDRRAYFNCLVNYINVKSYYGKKGYEDKRPAIQKITEKALSPWEPRFLPKIRSSNILPTALERRLSLGKVNLDRPFALIIPNRTGLSMHQERGLAWNMSQIRAFCTVAHHKGVKPIIMSNERGFYSKEALVLPLSIEFLIHILPKASAVLSEDMDFLLMANVISHGTIISKPIKGSLSTLDNNIFMERDNVIYTREELTPAKAVDLIVRKI